MLRQLIEELSTQLPINLKMAQPERSLVERAEFVASLAGTEDLAVPVSLVDLPELQQNQQQQQQQQRQQQQSKAVGLPSARANSAVLKLKGLPYSTNEPQIRSFFAEFKISRVAFVFEPDGRPSGLAFAEFETKGDAIKALSKNGSYIGERYVRLLHVPIAEMEEQVRLGTVAVPGNAAKLQTRLTRSRQRTNVASTDSPDGQPLGGSSAGIPNLIHERNPMVNPNIMHEGNPMVNLNIMQGGNPMVGLRGAQAVDMGYSHSLHPAQAAQPGLDQQYWPANYYLQQQALALSAQQQPLALSTQQQPLQPKYPSSMAAFTIQQQQQQMAALSSQFGGLRMGGAGGVHMGQMLSVPNQHAYQMYPMQQMPTDLYQLQQQRPQQQHQQRSQQQQQRPQQQHSQQQQPHQPHQQQPQQFRPQQQQHPLHLPHQQQQQLQPFALHNTSTQGTRGLYVPSLP